MTKYHYSQMLISHVMWAWKQLTQHSLTSKIALFGGGQHTVWLMELIVENALPKPAFIIDEMPQKTSICGIQVRKPEKVKAEELCLIVLSTDLHQEKFKKRIKELFTSVPDEKLIDLYEFFPIGPYEKQSTRQQTWTDKSIYRDNCTHDMHEKLNICISRPLKNAVSESFIQVHLEKLPGKIFGLYGSWFPTHTEDGRILSLCNKSKEESLSEFMIKNQINVFLAEYGLTGAEVMNSCADANVPLVVHFHGFDAGDLNCLKEYGEKYKLMFQKAKSIIAVSQEMKEQLISLGAPENKIIKLPYGVDPEFYAGIKKRKHPGTVFISCGRFVDKKAPHLTILAFASLIQKCPDAKLVMYGDGELREACLNLVEALHLSSSISLPGAFNHDDLPSIFAEADVFLQHSLKTHYGDTEGTPVAILEASAAGLPVISTKHAGIKEAVIDGTTGFLVDERDIIQMSIRMEELANSPDKVLRFGAAAKKHITRNYNMNSNIDSIYKILCAASKTN